MCGQASSIESGDLDNLPLYGRWHVQFNSTLPLNRGLAFHAPQVKLLLKIRISADHVDFLHPFSSRSSKAHLQTATVPPALTRLQQTVGQSSILNSWDAATVIHINEINAVLDRSIIDSQDITYTAPPSQDPLDYVETFKVINKQKISFFMRMTKLWAKTSNLRMAFNPDDTTDLALQTTVQLELSPRAVVRLHFLNKMFVVTANVHNALHI